MRRSFTKIIFSITVAAIVMFFASEVFSQTLAFPSAEGFGRFTTGGRGGEVVHVTNLNDAGAGSFRDAVSKPNRMVVFDVGGVINITERIVINRNIYVAGQTAPGGGITIYGNGIAFNGSSGNNIIRYIRIRMGKNGDSGKDAIAISEGQNYIFDNVSISWGRDGTFDVNGTGIDNITLQDCIVGQGINSSNHSTGGLLQSGKWSVIRSLYIDNKTRNPKARGTQEFINSVLYNWGTNGYIMGDTEGLSECNLIGNYFIYGPSSSSNSHITNTTPQFNVYGKDNWVDANKDGVLNGSLLTDYKTATVRTSPYAYPKVNNILSAQNALSHVLQNVGASRTRDAVDALLINQVLSYGKQGSIIFTEDDNGIAGNVGTVANGTPPKDTDRDGMPDDWEIKRGLNPNAADDKGDDDNDDYTNIEEYLSCLVGEGDGCTNTPPVVVAKKYIYIYDNSGNLSWNNTNSWTPKAVPTAIDTVIVRTGEVQIANLNHKAPVYVEANGILRLVDTAAVNDLRLQGGTLKAYTSSPGFVLTSNIKVEAPSTIMCGSVAATIFTLNGTITGSSDLTKTSVGNLRINSNASTFKGNWIVSEGKLQLRSVNGLGLCGVRVKTGAVLDIEAAASIYSLVIDSAGRVDLDQSLTSDVLVLGKENVETGSYTNASRPSFIGSVNTLIVKNSILTASGSTSLCAGGSVQLQTLSSSTYSWKNASIQVGTAQNYGATTAGGYTVTVSNANGCKVTSATVPVSVSAAPSATITAAGSTNICYGSSVILTSSVGNSYKWFHGTTQVGSGQAYTASAAGDYSVEVTNAAGCKATSAKISVVVNSLPTATITAGSSTTLCSGESVTLTSSAGSSYKWFNGSTQVGTNPTYTASAAGNYAVEVTNANGCKATSAVTAVTLNTSPTGSVTASGPTILCEGESVVLSFSSGASYKWFNGTTQVGTEQTYTATTSGNYSVEVTNSSGCKVTSPGIVVTVNAIPSASVTTNTSTVICEGESVMLTSSAGSSYKWFNGTTQVGSSQSYIASTSGDYLVEITNANGCKASSTKTTVTVNSLPLAVISAGNLSVCLGETVILTSSQAIGYKWYHGTTVVGTAQTYSATLTGDYKVEVTGANGCKAISPITLVQINVPVIPQITASGPTVLCEDESVELSSSAGVSYEWYNATALVGTDDSFIPGTSGEYQVVVTDEKGCKASSNVISIEISPCTPTSIGSVQDELKVQVFPNPFVDEILIQHTGRFSYQLFDSKGVLVQQGESIDVAHIGNDLSRGLYLLRIENGNREKSVTVVKE